MIRILSAAITIFAIALFTQAATAQETPSGSSTNTVDPAVARLLEKAAARGDGALETVTSIAIEADPDNAEAIRALAQSLASKTVEAPAVANVAAGPAPDDVGETASTVEPTGSFWTFSGWDGEVELSANRYTGNTDQMGLGLGVAAAKDVERWKHELRGLVEFEENDDETTKQRFLAGYDLNYTFNHRLYVFGNLLYEDDRFGGYDYRFSETVGLGYKVIENDSFGWNVEAGPGARHTNVENGGLETEFVGLLGSKFHWQINERSVVTHNYAMFIGSDRTTIDTTAALKLKINGALSARFSYNYRYDSNVPFDTKKTDTATKAALVYDF
ncbi:MAG: DUF481 domain-containing protein [Alphaproteobacteria bacterium]|nr:MAG: DUF481 domain-containing protein [Alphaproteobacteria bacterium]